MDNIALYVGYFVFAVSFVVGFVFLVAVILAKIEDGLPYFIGYKGLLKKDDRHFEKWIETLRYMREKKISKYIKDGLK